VQVQSKLGRGTQFRVYLPATKPDQSGQVTQPTAQVPSGLGELILVVDDEDSIRQITRDFLEEKGYRVLTAGDGFEALSIYAKKRQDIRAIILDMWMPFMDGPATIRELQKINAQVRIIAVSGLPGSQETAEKAGSAVRAFLPKPWTPNQLLETVNKVVRATC
jgi:CheY-like chemotaxis protein